MQLAVYALGMLQHTNVNSGGQGRRQQARACRSAPLGAAAAARYVKSRLRSTAGAMTVHRYSASQNHFDPIVTHTLAQPVPSSNFCVLALICQLVNSIAMYILASAYTRWKASGRYGSNPSASPVGTGVSPVAPLLAKMLLVPSDMVL